MTVDIFLSLLAIFAILTSVITEGVKKFLDSVNVVYASNVVVLIVSILVGGAGMVVFYLWNRYEWTSLHIICIFLMVVANWLSSMIGYDKVKQAIEQLKGGNRSC